MPAVLGEEFQRAFLVACGKHVGEFAMLGGDVPGVLVVADVDADQQEQMDLGADGVPRLLEAPVVRGGEDSVVEVQILLDGGVLVRGTVHPIGRGANSLQFGVRGVADQTLDGQLLQHIPQAVELLDGLGRQRGDGGAAVPLAAHQALALQTQQRFADRAATHPQHRRQLDLAQRRTGCVAREGRVFSLAANGLLGLADIPADFPLRAALEEAGVTEYCRGGSALAAPDGSWLVEPLADEERLVVADIDLADVRAERLTMDPTGHDSRPDVFTVNVDRRRRAASRFQD